jgi:hypothetical protein
MGTKTITQPNAPLCEELVLTGFDSIYQDKDFRVFGQDEDSLIIDFIDRKITMVSDRYALKELVQGVIAYESPSTLETEEFLIRTLEDLSILVYWKYNSAGVRFVGDEFDDFKAKLQKIRDSYLRDAKF